MVVIVNKNEKCVEKKILEGVKTCIEDLQSKQVGAKLNIDTSIDKNIINKFFILLENDGLFVDSNNRVVIWDKKTARRYNELVSSICKRTCSRTEKGSCCGCGEYIATAKINSSFLNEAIILNINIA